MSKALQGKARFTRWGKHYLRALMRSHQLQICTNFMDPGLQVYGGRLFGSLRSTGDAIFLSLPAPVPQRSFNPWGNHNSRPQAQRPSQRASTCRAPEPGPDMTTYYAGAGGGCFSPNSKVSCLRGVHEVVVELQTVRAGDVLRVSDGFSRVRCVVKLAREASKRMINFPGGLRITPKHPIRVDGAWRLPGELATGTATPCLDKCVYNVVLDRCHILLVNGVECATWAHGFSDDKIIAHPFFGTTRVLKALTALPGWQDGLVVVDGVCKHKLTNSVVGFCSAGPVDEVAEVDQ